MTNTFSPHHVKKLELQAGFAQVIFNTAPNEDIQVTAEDLADGTYLCEMQDDKLVVSYKPYNRIVHYPKHTKTLITLLLPENLILEHISLNLGAGKMNMKEFPLSCQDMDVSIGAGKWKAKQLSVAQNLHIEVGAGSVNLKHAKSGTMRLNCGAGECFYNGEINGGFQIDCAVGHCALQLTNKEQDFDYDISCAFGEVKINGQGMKSLGFEKHRFHENALGKAVLQCGVGKITLETA